MLVRYRRTSAPIAVESVAIPARRVGCIRKTMDNSTPPSYQYRQARLADKRTSVEWSDDLWRSPCPAASALVPSKCERAPHYASRRRKKKRNCKRPVTSEGQRSNRAINGRRMQVIAVPLSIRQSPGGMCRKPHPYLLGHIAPHHQQQQHPPCMHLHGERLSLVRMIDNGLQKQYRWLDVDSSDHCT